MVHGGEADFVYLDMMRSEAPGFTDDPHRLNIAVTRARQTEIIMTHPKSKSIFTSTLLSSLEDQEGRRRTVPRPGPSKVS